MNSLARSFWIYSKSKEIVLYKLRNLEDTKQNEFKRILRQGFFPNSRDSFCYLFEVNVASFK
jgi:hypothetical protein